ncbi:MAG: hypothetical protein VX000_10140, partial [Myxococcota bacterium]|nr:hypothetical protein [Myxococcota bacterium]
MIIRTARPAAGENIDLLVVGATPDGIAGALDRAVGSPGAGFATAAADDEFKAGVGSKVTYPAMGVEGATRL